MLLRVRPASVRLPTSGQHSLVLCAKCMVAVGKVVQLAFRLGMHDGFSWFDALLEHGRIFASKYAWQLSYSPPKGHWIY